MLSRFLRGNGWLPGAIEHSLSNVYRGSRVLRDICSFRTFFMAPHDSLQQCAGLLHFINPTIILNQFINSKECGDYIGPFMLRFGVFHDSRRSCGAIY